MLSPKEIAEYLQGASSVVEIKLFSPKEAKRIGEALGIRWETFDVEQFTLGLNKELEHGRRNAATDITHDQPMLTGRIALAHLNEIPDYYTRLCEMEQKAKRIKNRARRKSK